MGEIMTEQDNESGNLALTGGDRDAMAIATTRAAEEIKAQMVIAKKCPRDEKKAIARILRACERPLLALQAAWEYPRGGTMLDGPSIRLAEMLAQNWENITYGVTELAQDTGASVIQAFCHDLETNVKATMTFTVPHIRHTRGGQYKLTDPRDIYEMVANQGSRRLRRCILEIIPGDIVDQALTACNGTILKQSDEPLSTQINNAVELFAKFDVTEQHIADKFGVKSLKALTIRHVARLRRIYQSIKDGAAAVKQHFPKVSNAAEERAEQLRQKMKEKMTKGAKVAEGPAPTPPPKQSTGNNTALLPDEEIDPATGEISSTAAPADEPTQPQPMDDREKLIANYLDLCQARDVKPQSVTTMSNEALQGHIAALTQQ